MKKIIKLVGNILFSALVIVVVLSLIMSIRAKGSKDKIPSFLGYKPMTILTGSMAPKINPGDVIIDKSIKAEDIKVGDVITYKANENMLVTHRVIGIFLQNGKNVYKAKGDANDTDDGKLIEPEQVVGKVSFRIPYGGYISRFAGSVYGFILLILIPTGLLICEQMKTILSEQKKGKAGKIGQE
ncbi:signal peptidase I [Clostridium sp. YIM B02515]|uniref:Signal peptidase I n=1 Tax=Clostridium rhizosphaerae TaxID=2803861 RepID=A0ABS1TE34_9CLOT|nr:signal peptidase I [Clostridium rhizosphaerae]MBL4937496.1 signal peptidase I [Clostridium rhizosphaerae]